ncbi:hypothetical protein Dimus_004610 [Dionaea muscipula]
MIGVKKVRYSGKFGRRSDPFERLPDDLVISILSKLCSSSTCPADFINALIVCKRFNRLGLDRVVLARAGLNLFAIRAKKWSESVHRFLKQCVNAGSIEACYFLGMIQFYCLQNRGSGASLMAKAAIRSHAPALYSLAVIQFNGSGGSKGDKDLRAGAALCARAAYLGHIDAIREFGHCLQDGYGVRQNILEGRHLLVQANARELCLAFPSTEVSSLCRSSTSTLGRNHHHQCRHRIYCRRHQCRLQQCSNVNMAMGLDTCMGAGAGQGGCALMSDFGCNIAGGKPHPVNQFLVEWFELEGVKLGSDLRMCSHPRCGRPETRPHEFRRCSVCGVVNYCSRGCQAHDWKLRHKDECMPTEQWLEEAAAGGMGLGLGLGGLEIGEENNEQVVS